MMLVAESLEMWQRKAVLENPGLDFSPPVEVLIILLNHLANEMLLRAIILKGVTSSWLKCLSAVDMLTLSGCNKSFCLPPYILSLSCL